MRYEKFFVVHLEYTCRRVLGAWVHLGAPQGRPCALLVCIYRRAANPQKVLYLRSLMHPPTHLVCNDHLIANFLSFHMSLVVVMNCGAGNALRGFEMSMFYFFLKLYFMHISKDILPLRAQNAIKQCKWYISRKLLCQGLRKYKIGKSGIMQGRTAASYIMHDF